ncbi:MAG TPA: UTP--glucose-1-phosphate uridylyltransferase [Termitinemataceae bacterium]|nr:UTP--glucose-1-phosphate uridylyltransferase [Termitinemataceae bacterium]
MQQLQDLHPALRADLEKKGADIERTLQLLSILEHNKGDSSSSDSEKHRLPNPDNSQITDFHRSFYSIPLSKLEELLARHGIPGPVERWGERHGNLLTMSKPQLRLLGIHLYPFTAYGVLNGGSATTYGDSKKNRELAPLLYDHFQSYFDSYGPAIKDSPKGITPAFLQADGTPGPSFILLKMRSLLMHALEYRILTGDRERPLLPFFQMTSHSTTQKLEEAYREYRADPLLKELIEKTGTDPTHPLGACQGLLAAITHSSEGLPRRIFDRAYGRPHEGLALPGGHGENFRVLSPVYQALYDQGIRYVYLGNVDNSGYTIDPVELAYFALSDATGAFEFSLKTPIDVKGGVLVETTSGRLSVLDIGQGISREELTLQEQQGKPVLFNCAIGLFKLDYLLPRLSSIADQLPLHVSDQDKEAGRYAQIEQSTWEVLGLLEHPLIIQVKKEERFLAAKMFMETLLASPVSAHLMEREGIPDALRHTARLLQGGLQQLLRTEYGFFLKNSIPFWEPYSVQELEQALQQTLVKNA